MQEWFQDAQFWVDMNAYVSDWAQEAYGVDLKGPIHWVPTTTGFLDLALAGLAWGLQPQTMVQPHLEAGRLVELAPGHAIKIKLYWTVARIHASSLQALTEAVVAAAREGLR